MTVTLIGCAYCRRFEVNNKLIGTYLTRVEMDTLWPWSSKVQNNVHRYLTC